MAVDVDNSILWNTVYEGCYFIHMNIDGVAEDEEYIHIVLPLFVTYTVLSALGIIFATVCLIFNLWYRQQKYVTTFRWCIR